MTKLNGWKMGAMVLALCIATAVAAPAQTFTTLATFDGSNGRGVSSWLVQGTDGNFYGTTGFGGSNSQCFEPGYGCGTIFKIGPSGTLTTFYNFGSSADGDFPEAPLLLATDGNFYGTTGSTPTGQVGGTVFRITPHGKLQTLYIFCSQFACPDGATPSGLTEGSDGNLYGTTSGGGHCYNGCGTVFRVTFGGVLTTIHRFDRHSGPRVPSAGIIEGEDGNLYGTTTAGGAYGYGTVFKIAPTGELTTLHSFCSQPNCADGMLPSSGLIQATDGNFYGTTSQEGGVSCTGAGCGTLFQVTARGKLRTLYTFCAKPNCSDGFDPSGGLVQATDGNLYGTTFQGGNSNQLCPGGCGTIFSITLGDVLTTLYNFCTQPACADGYYPGYVPLQATNGTLYGPTYVGGSSSCTLYPFDGCGTIYSLQTGLAPFVAFVRSYGKVGQTGPILGQGFTGTTSVAINGIQANFMVVSDTYIRATVPPGAATGYVTVTTPTGVLTSNVPFRVIP